MLKEFKEFALRGNVIDMAVGVILGAAFGKVVSSLVQDVLMPPIGLLAGNVNFAEHFLTLSSGHYANLEEARKAGAATLNYGIFLNQVVDFLLVGFAVFLLVRQVNRFTPKPAASPSTRPCPHCLMEVPLKAARCGHCTSMLS